MDAIDRAIQQGKHITNNPVLRNQTWKQFEQTAKGKIVVLFGIGDGLDFYLYKYGRSSPLAMVVDNNPKIQGRYVRDFVFEPIDFE